MRHITRTNCRSVTVELFNFNLCSDQTIPNTQGLLDNRTDTDPENLIIYKHIRIESKNDQIIFTSVCTIWRRCARSILTV